MKASEQRTPVLVICSDDGKVIYADQSLAAEFVLGTIPACIAVQSPGKAERSATLNDMALRFQRVRTDYFTGYIGVIGNRDAENPTVQELEALNRELEAIFDSSHDGIVVADANGTFIKLNSSYERITNVSRDEIIGKNAWTIIAEGLVSDSATRHVLETGQPYTSQQTFRSGRQSIITGNPIFDDSGQIIRVVTNVRDMTEINRLKEQLAESQVKLHRYSKVVEKLTSEQTSKHKLIFRSQAMSLVRDTAAKFAKVSAPLLITGESGVGKEVIADFIHANSTRKSQPFLKINCGAIPETLLESELFGYEGGAFTGAKKEGRTGLFELANGGTLMLDEIGELSLGLQVKLLRFVQEMEFYRVGGERVIKVNVRVIAATNRNLQEMVDEKKFRSDLFFRLNVLRVHIPPLRERPEDIVPLLNHMLDKFNAKYEMEKYISSEVYRCLVDHRWTGNVRELENLIERLVVISESDKITYEYLPDEISRTIGPQGAINGELSYKEAKEEFERKFLSRVIEKYKSSRLAAEKIGVDHSTIVKKAARYGIKLMARTG